MSLRRWLLPDTPDLLGLLRTQAAVSAEALDAFASWAEGDHTAADAVRDAEHRADTAKDRLRAGLRDAFITPLEPEDLYVLSRGVDRIVNGAKDTVREAEVMATGPDRAVAELAALLAAAMRDLERALGALGADGADHGAEAATDAAIDVQRHMEKTYRRAMADLLALADLREMEARRELYRRCAQLGDDVVAVAERIVYAQVKGR